MAEQDRDFRLDCDMPCEVTQGEHSLRAAVINTSSGGVRLAITGGLAFEGVVGVALPKLGLRLDALVRWRNGDHAGLQVLRPGEAAAACASAAGRADAAIDASQRPDNRVRPPMCDKAISVLATQASLQALGVALDAYRQRRPGQSLDAIAIANAGAEQSQRAHRGVSTVIALVRDTEPSSQGRSCAFSTDDAPADGRAD